MTSDRILGGELDGAPQVESERGILLVPGNSLRID